MALVNAPSDWRRPAQDEENGGAGSRSFWKSRAGLTILGVVPALAALIAFNVVPNLLWPPGEISETWTTVDQDGMSLELPDSFDVYTDPEEAADALEQLSGGGEEAADLVRENPEVLVVAALHDPAESEYVVEVDVLRFPPEDVEITSVRDFADAVISNGAPGESVLDDEDVVVGTGGYEAVRIDLETQLEGERGRTTAYFLVDSGGTYVVIDYLAPSIEHDRFEAVFEQSIASLELP
jgi:hypothetical protein